MRWSRWFPILHWGRHYRREQFAADGVAASVVTLMLIPQSLAYALLAGMPAHTGLYASMAPLVLYALLGSSSTLAVGPAAVTSLMCAAAAGVASTRYGIDPVQASVLLALLSGLMMLAMGVARLGFVAHFLSHPVVSGFVSASGLLIAASQLKHLVGMPLPGAHLWDTVYGLLTQLHQVHLPTLAIGGSGLAFLLWARRGAKPLLRRWGLSAFTADLLAKMAPVLALALSIGAVTIGQLDSQLGVKVIGEIPRGLPSLQWPQGSMEQVQPLLLPAFLIALVGFVESVSIGQSLAARRRERIDPDAELRALGASNIGAALNGGFPVTGGFSRSVVNFDAGARTPAAGAFTAIGLAVAALFLTPVLFHLPQAILAATIMVAVLSLVDLPVFRRTWRYSRTDFLALLLTFVVTLLVGIDTGLMAGGASALLMWLYRSSMPHIATVGQVPHTEHYRNVQRHQVITWPHILGLRVDESLYFANARYLEDHVAAQVAAHPAVREVVLQCSAVNDIDASALDSLDTINSRLQDSGIRLHLSEVKGPVMDRLQRSDLLQQLSGQVFLTHHQAVQALVEHSDHRTAP